MPHLLLSLGLRQEDREGNKICSWKYSVFSLKTCQIPSREMLRDVQRTFTESQPQICLWKAFDESKTVMVLCLRPRDMPHSMNQDFTTRLSLGSCGGLWAWRQLAREEASSTWHMQRVWTSQVQTCWTKTCNPFSSTSQGSLCPEFLFSRAEWTFHLLIHDKPSMWFKKKSNYYFLSHFRVLCLPTYLFD